MADLKDNTVSELLDGVWLDPKESLVQQIYTILMDCIVNIRLKPGQAMSEKEISDSLKASKTPVREALIKLEDTGLVRVVPKSGTYVSPISLDRYIEACFIRLQLEIGAVRRAAERNNDLRGVLHLETTISRQVKALKPETINYFSNMMRHCISHFLKWLALPVSGSWLRKPSRMSTGFAI